MPLTLIATNRWLPYAILVLTLAFYPILGTFLASLGIVNTTPIAIGYRAIYLAFSLFTVLSCMPVMHRLKLPLVIPSFLLFWTIYTARIFNDLVIEGFSGGYAGKGVFFFLTYGLGGCLAPAIAVALTVRLIDFQRLQKLLLAFFGLCGLSILAFLIKENGFSMEILGSRLRVADSVVSPIIVAQYGGALLLSALSFWLIHQKKSWWLPVCIILGAALLVLGSSRGPLLAAGGSLLIILADHFRSRAKAITYWLQAVLIFGFIAWFAVKFVVPILDQISLLNRVTSTLEQGKGLDARGIQWSAAWEQFLSSPVWGDALVEKAYKFYPHNMVLELLMSTGILGILALLPAIVIVARKFVLRSQFEPEKRIIFYLLFFFTGCAMFSLALITITHVWVLWALAASLPLAKSTGNVAFVKEGTAGVLNERP